MPSLRSRHGRPKRLLVSSTPSRLKLRRPEAWRSEPQHPRAWRGGAEGEETLARSLARGTKGRGVVFLHDRRVPRSRASIDHIAIGPSGVAVIAAKRYRGRIEVERRGGLFREHTEHLLVGRRDCTELVDGVVAQADVVRAILADGHATVRVPVRAVLCFVEGEWPWSGSVELRGVPVVTPQQAAKLCASGQLPAATVTEVADALTGAAGARLAVPRLRARRAALEADARHARARRSGSGGRGRCGRRAMNSSSTRAPRARAWRPSERWRLIVWRLRVTRLVTFLNGQPRPEQRMSIRVPRGKFLAVSLRFTVREPDGAQRLPTRPSIAANGTIRVSQFSSTPLPAISLAPGWIAALASLQSCGRGKPSPSTVEVRGVGAGAVLVDAVVGRVDGAGVDRGVGVVAVGGAADAVAVGVALDLLARDAGVAVVADRGVVAVAAVDLLGAAVAGDDVVVAGAAVEDVDPAAAEQPVVAGAAVEDHRQRDARADRRDVVAVAEVEHHGRDAGLRAVDALVVGADLAAGAAAERDAAEAREADARAGVEAGDLVDAGVAVVDDRRALDAEVAGGRGRRGREQRRPAHSSAVSSLSMTAPATGRARGRPSSASGARRA